MAGTRIGFCGRATRSPRAPAQTALSLGERVSGDSAFFSCRWTGEGFLPRRHKGGPLPGTDPSPVTLRLMTAPEHDTLSPGERAVAVGLAGWRRILNQRMEIQVVVPAKAVANCCFAPTND